MRCNWVNNGVISLLRYFVISLCRYVVITLCRHFVISSFRHFDIMLNDIPYPIAVRVADAAPEFATGIDTLLGHALDHRLAADGT